jgi:hypothetical protein
MNDVCLSFMLVAERFMSKEAKVVHIECVYTNIIESLLVS